MDIPFGIVDWINNLRFNKEREPALITDIGEFWDCTMELDGKHYTALDFGRIKRGWIQYDIEGGEDLCKERCVVVGKKSIEDGYSEDGDNEDGDNKDRDNEDGDTLDVKEYYILVVRPTSVDGEYKRVGVGLIQSGYVVRQRLDVRVV